MKKKIFFVILPAVLFSSSPAFAALQVPLGSPLQPIPQNSGPNYTQNLNSDDSTYNQNQNQVPQTSPSSTPTPASEVTPPAPVPTDTVVAASTEPILLYWILLIIGSLGLIGVLGWLYWRFRK